MVCHSKKEVLIIINLTLIFRSQTRMMFKCPANSSLEGLTYNNIKEAKRITSVEWCYCPHYWRVITVDGQTMKMHKYKWTERVDLSVTITQVKVFFNPENGKLFGLILISEDDKIAKIGMIHSDFTTVIIKLCENEIWCGIT